MHHVTKPTCLEHDNDFTIMASTVHQISVQQSNFVVEMEIHPSIHPSLHPYCKRLISVIVNKNNLIFTILHKYIIHLPWRSSPGPSRNQTPDKRSSFLLIGSHDLISPLSDSTVVYNATFHYPINKSRFSYWASHFTSDVSDNKRYNGLWTSCHVDPRSVHIKC